MSELDFTKYSPHCGENCQLIEMEMRDELE